MILAAWNINNRVGKVRFRDDAARAAAALGVDVVVFTEYFPQDRHSAFCESLRDEGLTHTQLSTEPGERANRVLIASRTPLATASVSMPTFDRQFPANMLAVDIPAVGLRLIGVRVPAYEFKERSRLAQSWEWLATTAVECRKMPAVIIGDLNARAPASRRGEAVRFQRVLDAGWTRTQPSGEASYFGHRGVRSEIDHVLTTPQCRVGSARYVTSTAEFLLAGGPGALSDHAALVVDLEPFNPPLGAPAA